MSSSLFAALWRAFPAALIPFAVGVAQPAAMQPIKAQSAKASSAQPRYPVSNAIDGKVSDDSRWVSQASPEPSWLAVDLGGKHRLAGVHLFSGYGNTAPLANFELQFDRDGQWVTIPSAVISGNQATALAVPFDATMQVETSKLRLWVTVTHQNVARVKELVIWPGEAGAIPPLPKAAASHGDLVCAIPQAQITPLYLNQSGFNSGKPKRFTAPTLAEGTPFEVRPAGGGGAVFKGVIRGHKGDISAFEPGDDREYVVAAGGLVSVPFRIAPLWFERTIYQNAVDFMIDSRHYVGNDRNPCRGSFGWRDDHHFGWQLHTLVPQYISNPSAYVRMPRQVKYEVAKDRRLWGALDPYHEDAPDIVKLIHWGADIIVTQKVMHEHLKAQLAYFLYAWPVLEPWLPKQNHEVVAAYAHQHWDAPGKDHSYPYDESPDNMWDFRRLDDADGWTPMGEKPQMWNEPGNITGFPAALLAAREFVSPAMQPRIDELVWSHLDNFSGRNPVGRHFCFRAPTEIEGVEYGRFSRYPGGIGRLAKARFVIDGAPKNQHYPHHPEIGNVGWTEGWVQFNTPLNLSLAYLAWSETSLEVQRDGDDLLVCLRAPLDFDPAKAETGTVVLASGQGDNERVTVIETGPATGIFEGCLRLQANAAMSPNDGTPQFRAGTTVQASHGFGYLGRRATLKL